MGNKTGILYLIPSAIAPETGSLFLNKQMEGVLRQTNYFLAENIRESRRFISSLRLGIDISGLRFEQLDKNTSELELAELLAPLENGDNVGLLSDAGCPGVADPGAIAVKYVHKKNGHVIPLVGPSSILMALMASGLNGQSFAFMGYLPIDVKEATAKIKSLEQHSRKFNQTQIFIETPYRTDKLFQMLLKTLHPTTLLTVASDIMGEKETIRTASVNEWRSFHLVFGKQPTVFLLLSE